MSIDAPALLGLMWLASPALPVGGFSYSEGLEAAIEQGLVGNEASAAGWLADQLHLGLARAELPLVAQAHRAWSAADMAAAAALDGWMHASRESHELRLQTLQMGRSMADWVRERWPGDERAQALASRNGNAPFAGHGGPSWPLAFALAAVLGGAAPREALLAYGFGWAENQVQAALKAVPLGQNAGQRLLGRLAAELPAAVDAALAQPPDTRQAFTPGLAILSSRHEVQYSRLFRS